LESGNKDLPSRAVLLTFDDAYCDFAEHAWPILKRFGLSATLFVPTAYPDQPGLSFWWDDLYQAIRTTSQTSFLDTPVGPLSLSHASRFKTFKHLKTFLKTLNYSEAMEKVKQYCRQLGAQPSTNSVLSWHSLRKLTDEGVILGAHSRTHPLMDRVELGEAREEAVGSLKDLEREIGTVLPVFAYPGGAFSDSVVDMLEQEGLKLAFTTMRGINNLHSSDPLRVRRINVGGGTTLPILRAQLLPIWQTK
jgi:peptidoglycan/xylan/chitin deacetylase (PgdA/CDA1 family)